MSSVANRRNQQIWDAIDANNIKQALQLCMKRLKKGERSDELLALRAYVLMVSPSTAHREQGLQCARALAEKDPAITEKTVLLVLQQALSNVDASGRVGGEGQSSAELVNKLWERAVKSKPKDEELCRDWFFSAFMAQDWRSAQKAAMNLQKSFLQKREYFFWAILCCHMLHESHDASESEHKLFGTLAYRMISKAASDVPSDPGTLLSPGRTVQTPQELQMLVSIYRAQGHTKELVTLLQSSNLGTSSRVAKGDWSLIRSQLDILEVEGLWQDEWDICKRMLDGTEYGPRDEMRLDDDQRSNVNGDDWRVWQGLVRSSGKINTEKTRNARLAQMDLASSIDSTSDQQERKQPDLLSLCKDYFDDYGTQSYGFNDFRPYVEKLSGREQLELCQHMEACISCLESADDADEVVRKRLAVARITSLKFDFSIRVFITNGQWEKSLIVQFILDCMKAHEVLIATSDEDKEIHNQSGDDACVLAVMALIHLSKSESAEATPEAISIRTFQAASLLDRLLSRSKHNYQASLLLVRLNSLLGSGSMAIQTYHQLSIKQIQNDTLAHNLYSRISTIHPRSITTSDTTMEKQDQDPGAGLAKALDFYDRSASKIPKMSKLALEQGSYNQIHSIFDLGGRIQRSICRSMWQIEHRRTTRLYPPISRPTEESDVSQLVPPGPKVQLPQLCDNRDYDVMTSYEAAGQSRFEEHVRLGPTPNRWWVQAFNLCEQLVDVVMPQNAAETMPQHPITETTKAISSQLQEILKLDDLLKEVTKSERAHIELHRLLSEAVTAVLGPESDLQAVASAKLESVVCWLRSRKDDYADPKIDAANSASNSRHRQLSLSWEQLHQMFLDLDGLNIVRAWLDLVASKKDGSRNSKHKAAFANIKNETNEVFQRVRSGAARIKNDLSESGVIGVLVDQALGRTEGEQDRIGAAIERFMGEPDMETLASKVVDSWQDALDGVLGVQIQ
ncbi:MAG: hypothetical protein M1833_001302 [Piccolia ochrophora]|nr:MAG: hypothetical protein M1833_001302 [Piccolia ochrophora]